MATDLIMESAVSLMFDRLGHAVIGACYLGKDQSGLTILANIIRGIADDIESKTLSGETIMRVHHEITAYAQAAILEAQK